MRLHVPDTKFIVTQQTDDHGVSSIHIGNIDTGPVCELLVTTGEHVEVSRDSFVHQHIPGFGADEMVPAQQAEPAQAPRPTHDGPGRFRKMPVEIDAVLWDGQEDTLDIIVRWSSGAELKVASREWGYTLTIPTLEGEMNASLGDWIIRGVKGEVYPCKPDIFAATYEAVN